MVGTSTIFGWEKNGKSQFGESLLVHLLINLPLENSEVQLWLANGYICVLLDIVATNIANQYFSNSGIASLVLGGGQSN